MRLAAEMSKDADTRAVTMVAATLAEVYYKPDVVISGSLRAAWTITARLSIGCVRLTRIMLYGGGLRLSWWPHIRLEIDALLNDPFASLNDPFAS